MKLTELRAMARDAGFCLHRDREGFRLTYAEGFANVQVFPDAGERPATEEECGIYLRGAIHGLSRRRTTARSNPSGKCPAVVYHWPVYRKYESYGKDQTR